MVIWYGMMAIVKPEPRRRAYWGGLRGGKAMGARLASVSSWARVLLSLLVLQNSGLGAVHGLLRAACAPELRAAELRAVALWGLAIWGPENKNGALD